jgi:hypothetical protein
MSEHRPPENPGAADGAHSVDCLSNDDIHWDGTAIGLVPTLAGDKARQCLAIGNDVIPLLIGALGDETRFVAAHVLLTLLSGVEHQTVPWNGLNVELFPNGGLRIDPRQRFELARRWREWEQTKPPPRSLPPSEPQ